MIRRYEKGQNKRSKYKLSKEEDLELTQEINKKFDALINCIISLNQTITYDETLGEGFCIGHSYFCNLEEIDDKALSDIVEYEIIPMLKEYWFDEPAKVRDWSERLRSAVK